VLLALIPQTPDTEELLNVLYANTGIAGIGLLVTAIQQTAKQELSFFHAIFVQHMLFFLGTGVAPIGKYTWSRGRIAMGIIIQFVSVIAFTVWALYLWVHAKDFGYPSLPPCNDQVIYVLMFVNVRATASWLRGLWIATLVLSALGLMIIFGYNAFALYVKRNDVDMKKTEESEKGWYFYISIFQILIAIYSTVVLELAVYRNSHNGGVVTVNNGWAFGQTLAVLMIFANINEIVHCLFGYFARRRKHSHEPQVEAQQASNDTDVPLESIPYRPRGRPGSHLSARDPLSSEHEPLNLKENSRVSKITVGENTETRDQPVGTLR